MKATLTLDLDTGDIEPALAKAQALVKLLTEARTLATELGAFGNGEAPPPALKAVKEPPPPVLSPQAPAPPSASPKPKAVSVGKRRRHSEADKRRGVGLAKQLGVPAAAAQLGVHPALLRTWVKKAGGATPAPPPTPEKGTWAEREARLRAAAGEAL